MLDLEGEFSDEAVFDEQRFTDADAGVEVEVGHRERLFKDVPEYFLGVEKV